MTLYRKITIFLFLLLGSLYFSSIFSKSNNIFFTVYIGELSYLEPINNSLYPYEYPFTEKGLELYTSYDPNFDDPRQKNDCAKESIPAHLLTEAVAKLEFKKDGENILMLLERDDAIRVIHMNVDKVNENISPSLLGYSTGEWRNGSLIIKTSHLLGGVIFAQRSYPISSNAIVTEKYTPNANTNDLKMYLEIFDPSNYTDIIAIERNWAWRPDSQIYPWNCINLGSREDPLDLERLRDMLQGL